MSLRASCFFVASLALAVAVGAQPSASWKNLEQTQAALGFTNYVWDGDSVCLSNESQVVRFYQGRRRSEVNGTVVWMNVAPEGNVKAGEWRIAEADFDFLTLSLWPQDFNAIKPLRVMLDAGHGGADSGACSVKPKVAEKQLVLDLTRKVGERLESLGMQVIYTRTNDVAVALDERSRKARRSEADVFVSIHANFAGNTNACGPETYVVIPAGFQGTAENTKARGFQIGNVNDYHNTLLGFSAQKHLARIDAEVPDRGLKRQSFFVLREVSCPAILIEIGFLSNEAETQKMLTPEWQEDCADAIMRGVVEYARKVETLTLAVNEKRQRVHAAKEEAKALAARKKAAEATPEPEKKTQDEPQTVLNVDP